MRNVLVANYDSYDIDQVICDMTESYVVDDDLAPEPLNVMELVRRYQSPAAGFATGSHSHAHPQSQFLQLHRISGFKIDPSFFVKYPGLFDATAIAKGACASIRIHERGDVCQRPLPLTGGSAGVYLDMVALGKEGGFR